MRARSGLVAAVMSVTLVAAACGNSTETTPTTSTSAADPVAVAQAGVADAEAGVGSAQDALTTAHQGFCGTAKDYVEILDRYGRVFTDRSATVGDVQTLGADLVAPRDDVVAAVGTVTTARDDLVAAQQALVDAEAALAAAVNEAAASPSATLSPTPTPTPTTVTTPTLLPSATIDRVEQAEQDLAQTERGINAQTPLVDAGAAFNSAALALEIAWLNLLVDAGCVTDEREAEALARLNAYTLALQTDLKRAGYDPGPIDGIYGPQTVAAVEQLQKDSGLAVTGFVDEATARALRARLDAVGQQEAAATASQTAALQTVLTLMGYWDGPIDGQWTDALTQALKAAQTSLGVPPTGVVDPATLVAFQQALAALEALVTSSPATATETATQTATETETATATATKTATATATKTETATKTATETVTKTSDTPPTSESDKPTG